MARRNNKVGRVNREGGLHTLGQRDWAEKAKRLRRWVSEHQNCAVYRHEDGWTLLQSTIYLEAGLLSCFRFSEQRAIAASVLGL